MVDISLKLKVVTPLFMTGANQDAVELREPSIKGMLRFWYRAIYPNDTEGEARVFGGHDKKHGQSKVLLKIKHKNLDIGAKEDQTWNGKKTAYLGYGVITREKIDETYTKNGREYPVKKEVTVRPYIKPGSRFTLEILFKPLPANATEQQIQTYDTDKSNVENVIWAWVMFGGLGARSRKGFGSLVIEEANGIDKYNIPNWQPKNRNDLQAALQQFTSGIHSVDNKLPPKYTHWSDKAKCIIIGNEIKGEDILEKLGEKIHDLRSFRGNHKLENIVVRDHDLMRNFLKNPSNRPAGPPIRAAFGLPHNYFFTSLGNALGEVNVLDNNGKKGRRASPLFFSVYQFLNGETCVIALFLPAQFLGPDKKITISKGGDQYPVDVSDEIQDFTAIDALLNKLELWHGLKI